MRPLLDPTNFVGLDGVAHLCTGGEAPWLKSHDEACRRFGMLKSGGMAGRENVFQTYSRAKWQVAALLGVSAENVAFLAHASEGLNLAVSGIDWTAGDSVVVADVEYPSLRYPAGRLREIGVETRVARAREHYVSIDDVAALVDARTRLVLVSHVSYVTGQRVDLARYAELCRRTGALLAVDVTHALGVAPVAGSLCDFVVSACYKWLLATHGVGIFAYKPSRVGDLRPNVLGWRSAARPSESSGGGDPSDPLAVRLQADATRFEAGNPSLLSIFVLESALATLGAFQPPALLAHTHALGDELIAGLRQRGRRIITPESRDERAGNVCFLDSSAPATAAGLAERGVLAWGSEGRIRVSPHVHNSGDDIARFFDALDAVA